MVYPQQQQVNGCIDVLSSMRNDRRCYYDLSVSLSESSDIIVRDFYRERRAVVARNEDNC
jgi:hypothetical protein